MPKIDRLTRGMLVLLIIGVWGLLLRPAFSPTPAYARQRASWEYKTVQTYALSELNAAAKEGWEAFQMNNDVILLRRAI